MTCDHHNRPGGFSIILLLFPLFLALAFSIYSNILSAPFLYDDVVFRYDPIVHIGSLSQLLDILFDWDVSRRVGFITFAFNFYVDGLNPFGYHLFNIIIHALTALVLFFVTLKTLTLPSISGRWKARAPRIALLGSLIWLVHPVQIMAVSYTVQRFASLAALFFLLSILCYILGRLRQRKSRLTFFALSFLCGLAALGSKENAAMLPFVILLYEFFFFMDLSFKENRRKVLAAAIAVGLLALLLTILIVGPDVATLIEKGMAKKGMTLFERVMTQFRVVVLYLTLLIFPHPSRLNVDYDFALSKGLFNPPSTFLSLLLLAGLLAFALFRAKKNPLFSFSLLWFFANLVIESSVFPLDMVYEHRLYLPSMGPIMLFAGSIAAFEHPLLKKAGILMGILIALLFSYWTYERNRIWQDPVTLWEDNVKKSPGKARVHGNLGKAYLDKGLYEKARLAFERTIELDPTLLGAYDNLATIYIDHFRDYGRAREFLYEALNRNPDFPSPYLNLGVINLRLKELPEAVKHFEKVLALDPHSRLGHYNLAAARFNQREYDKALSILKKGITLWPRSSMLYGLLGLTYYHKGERAHAGTALTRALELDPSNRMAGACLDKIRQGGHTTPP